MSEYQPNSFCKNPNVWFLMLDRYLCIWALKTQEAEEIRLRYKGLGGRSIYAFATLPTLEELRTCNAYKEISEAEASQYMEMK